MNFKINMFCKFHFILFVFLITLPVYSDNFSYTNYPQIKALNDTDIFFKQITSDITLSYKVNSSGKKKVPISIYRYLPGKEETLFAIASRLNIPYESISTLNRISSINEFDTKKEIIIPNQPILFIPNLPSSDIEYILKSRDVKDNDIVILKSNGSKETFNYITDERFNTTERAFFLNTFFRFPIDKGKITSHYGYRQSPITGNNNFHYGIDIAAPLGTPVFTAGKGVVVENGYSDIFGKYIIIQHPGSYLTLYGHLKESFVILNNQINTGTIIGEVGSTGYSTGPHLHFEVRSGDKVENPLILFNRKQ